MVSQWIANPSAFFSSGLVGSIPAHSGHLSTIAIHRYVSVEKESVYGIALDSI